MENKKCFYLVEGECEEKLLKALKGQPALIDPGSVKKFNVIQNKIPASKLMSFDPGSRVVLVFDTDKEVTEQLKKNIEMLKKMCSKLWKKKPPKAFSFIKQQVEMILSKETNYSAFIL